MVSLLVGVKKGSAKGRTRTTLFVVVLCRPFRAPISLIVLMSVGRCWCVFVLDVALVVALDSYGATLC